MALGLFDNGEDGGYNGVGLVEISKIFGTQVSFFFVTGPFNEVCVIVSGILSAYISLFSLW